MTTLASRTATIPAASTCPVWCLGRGHHDELGVADCVSAPVTLAAGVEAWLSGTPGGSSRVVVCGVAPELDSDAMLVFLRRLAGLWALMN